MPMRAKHLCNYPGCGNLTTGYYCEGHKKLYNKNYDKYVRPYEHKERYGAQWNKVRNLYFKSHPLCEECLKNNVTTPGTLVHHKLPIEDGGEIYDMENLETVCTSCHEKLHKALERK